MDEVLSIEAPKKPRKVGSRNGAIFMGLPGEENEFVKKGDQMILSFRIWYNDDSGDASGAGGD